MNWQKIEDFIFAVLAILFALGFWGFVFYAGISGLASIGS